MLYRDAVDLENEEIWTSIDMYSSNDDVLINRLSLRSGTSQYCYEYTDSLELGHGQDLSLEQTSSGMTYLWTGDSTDRGVARVNPETLVINEVPNLLLQDGLIQPPPLDSTINGLLYAGQKMEIRRIMIGFESMKKSALEQVLEPHQPPPPLYGLISMPHKE